MAQQTVVGFRPGVPNSGIGKYVLAVLACGHVGDVKLMARRGTCYRCGGEQELSDNGTTCATCGYRSFVVTFQPDPHNPAHYVTQIGDSIACETCTANHQALEWLRTVDPSTVHHARYRTWCGQGQYHLYRLDPTSPSNFMLIGSVPSTPEIEVLMRQMRLSALSPTECA